MEQANGLDVSHYQGKSIVWPSVSGAGYKFVYIKQSDGAYWRDPYRRDNMAGARGAGLLRGGYHFWRNHNIESQYDNFMYSLDKDLGELPPMVDVEIDGVYWTWLYNFTQKLKVEFGREPVIYSSVRYWKDTRERWKVYPLMVADWTYPLSIPKPWESYTIFQYRVSPVGYVPGIPTKCDLDVFNGTYTELLEWAHLALPDPEPEPVTLESLDKRVTRLEEIIK